MPNIRAGNTYAFSQSPYSGMQDSLTLPGYQQTPASTALATVDPSTGSTTSAGSIAPPYLAYIGGFFLLMIALRFLQEHDRSGIDGANVGVNVHNLVICGALSALFIVVLKVIVNKYLNSVKGVSDLVNMI